uniref:Uncharacterized protein n=1 Tax=Leersia perrieri TaxID=77586 RepID=A0A0D9V1S6_9ORYZ
MISSSAPPCISAWNVRNAGSLGDATTPAALWGSKKRCAFPEIHCTKCNEILGATKSRERGLRGDEDDQKAGGNDELFPAGKGEEEGKPSEPPLSDEDGRKFENVDCLFRGALISILADNIVDEYMCMFTGKKMLRAKDVCMVRMEASLVSGILSIVGTKLAPLVMKEFSSMAYVANDAEDLVHEFHIEAEKHEANVVGIKNVIAKHF